MYALVCIVVYNMRKNDQTSIRISKNTLEMLKQWQKELSASSIEDTILLSLKWSQMLDGNLVPNITDINSRLISFEGWLKSNSMYLIRFANSVIDQEKRMNEIEFENRMLKKKLEILEKKVINNE